MKDLLNRLIRQESLAQDEAYKALAEISSGAVNPAQMAAFMTVYMMRPITLAELAGFRMALLDLCLAIDLSAYNPIDLCGTGGDGKDTFNISTLASFVTAGCGVPVAKHGNYGVSSVSGSSNVLEYLGIVFTNQESQLKRALDQAGICFMHAPLFHPAMKQVAPIRKELGVRTFFNLLGPLVNPARLKQQLTGVFNLELARLYHYLFQQTNMRYAVVHSLDGYDEISLTGSWKFLSHETEQVLPATYFSGKALRAEELFGGNSVPEAAALFTKVLHNDCTDAQLQVVCANAAPAISLAKNIDLIAAYAQAVSALTSGKALQAFQKLQALS